MKWWDKILSSLGVAVGEAQFNTAERPAYVMKPLDSRYTIGVDTAIGKDKSFVVKGDTKLSVIKDGDPVMVCTACACVVLQLTNADDIKLVGGMWAHFNPPANYKVHPVEGPMSVASYILLKEYQIDQAMGLTDDRK